MYAHVNTAFGDYQLEVDKGYKLIHLPLVNFEDNCYSFLSFHLGEVVL